MSEDPQQSGQWLVPTLRRILTPVIRMLIHFGITLPFLNELIKSIYVDIAEREFSTATAKKVSDSRISLITGVHRKDVKRLRCEAHEDSAPSRNVSMGARLIATWLQDPRYQDEHGKPRILAKQTSDEQPSFEDLVNEVSKGDLRPKVMLDELLRQGSVALLEDASVQLLEAAYIPKQNLQDIAFYLGKNLHDHASAASKNFIAADCGDTPEFLDRCVYYDGLSETSVKTLQKMAEELGMKNLLAINQKAAELQAQDRQSLNGADAQRMHFGIYFYSEQEPANEDSDNV